MANSKSKKKNQRNTVTDDVEAIKSDVASFASSLGLASSVPNSGFNDVDFRKTGPLKPNKKNKKPAQDELKKHENKKSNKNPKPVRDELKQHENRKPNKNAKPAQDELKQYGNKKPDFRNTDNNNNNLKNGNLGKPQYQKPSSHSSSNGSNNDAAGASFKSYEKYKGLPKLPLLKANALGVWYMDEAELEKKVLGSEGGERKRVEPGDAEEWKKLVEKKKELGERLLAQYAIDYESSRGQSGDIKMLFATQRSGTAADKVSAYSVLLGDNPVANIRSLDALLAMVTSKVGKRHALAGFESLKELFIQSLLPDRKLKALFQRPLKSLPENKDGNSLLLFWHWEECLKLRYERFLSALEEASRDMLPILKDKGSKIMYVLLKSKSEQERRLLSALVNKLGDPQNKAASNADYHLTNLLSEHPNMKGVVIDEVDSFLFRPHLGLRAKYHAVNFLSQIRLSHRGDGPKAAKRLIDVYFALFKLLISEANNGQKETQNGKLNAKQVSSKVTKPDVSSENHVDLDSRLLSALLTGVNRAFPFVSSDEADEIVQVQTPMLFKLVHSNNFNVGIQALMLLDKISSKNQIASDRFYRALYTKMLLPAAMNSSKAEMFIGLLMRAMKNDVNVKRVAAFSKRLLQVALQQPAQFACGSLFLLSEVLKARPPLWNMVLQNESLDEELEHFKDILDDSDNKPITVKDPETKHDDVLDGDKAGDEDAESLEDKEAPNDDEDEDDSEDESDDEEVSPSSSVEDDESDEAEDDFLIKENVKNPQQMKINSSFENHETQHQESNSKASLPGGYNPQHREPSYCNADRASWWELTVLASHAHPSVATMARTLLSGANIVYNGNPLNDLSLPAFLDKFMEKKPKQNAWHGGSDIEPAKQMEMSHHLIGEELLSLAEEDVPPEDQVFHRFYTNKMSTSTKPKKKKKKKILQEEEAAEEIYGGDDDSDNEEIDNILDASEPTMEDGDGDYDYDDLDKVADDDDDDLIGDVSGAEMDLDIGDDDISEADGDIPDFGDDDIPDFGDDSDDDDDDGIDGDIKIGDADDGSDDDEDEGSAPKQIKRKRKSVKKSSSSPFASLEEYEHLLNDDDGDDDGDYASKEKSGKNRKSKSRKKKKSAK